MIHSKLIATIVISLSSITVTCAADYPSIGGIKLGAVIGQDISLCTPAQPKLYSCAATDTTCEKLNDLKLKTFQEIIPPEDGSMCLGTNRYLSTDSSNRLVHWVVNPVKMDHMAIDNVYSYEKAVSAITVRLNWKPNETYRETNNRITKLITEISGVSPEIISNMSSCSGEGKNLSCYVNIQKKWVDDHVTYNLKLGLSSGSLSVSAKFAEPPAPKYVPLLTK